MAHRRRANSFPAHVGELLAGSLQELELLDESNDGRAVTSPSFEEPRSPPGIATFSPVFDLELGTPQEPQQQKHRPSHLRRAALAPVPFRHLPPSSTAAAASRQQPSAPRTAAGVPPCAGLDRSQSDMQVMLSLHQGAKGAGPNGPDPLTPAAERLHDLCKPIGEVELELSKRLREFRNARITKPPAAKAAAGEPSATVALADCGLVSASTGGPSGPMPGEIEALAFELQSQGWIVQVLDGQRLGKDARLCLRTLKHRFLVCLGRGSPLQRRSLQGSERRLDAAGLQQQQQQHQQQQLRLTEPLVVEVRFREQFLIANPSRDYEHLLMALPVVFVGPMRRLDAAVELMAAEVAAVFKQAGRSLPPWRTKAAMLSKWAPSQLLEIERMMRHMASATGGAQQQRRLLPPAKSDTEASWTAALTGADPCAAAAAVECSSVSEPLLCAPNRTGPGVGSSSGDDPPLAGAVQEGLMHVTPPDDSVIERDELGRDDDPRFGADDAAAAAAAVPRSTSMPSRSLRGTQLAAAAAAAIAATAPAPTVLPPPPTSPAPSPFAEMQRVEPKQLGLTLRAGVLGPAVAEEAPADAACHVLNPPVPGQDGHQVCQSAAAGSGPASGFASGSHQAPAAVFAPHPAQAPAFSFAPAELVSQTWSAPTPRPGGAAGGGLTFPRLPEADGLAACATARTLLGPLAPPPCQGEAATPSEGPVPPAPDPKPSLLPAARSAFSAFACVSMPEELETGYADPRDPWVDAEEAAPGNLSAVSGGTASAAEQRRTGFGLAQIGGFNSAGDESADGAAALGCMPVAEFTLKHSALAPIPQHHYEQEDQLDEQYGGCDVGHRDTVGHGGGGGGWRAPTMPMPTPPRVTTALHAAAAADAGGGAGGSGTVQGSDGRPGFGARRPEAVGPPGAAAFLRHQPLAAGAIGGLTAAAANRAAAGTHAGTAATATGFAAPGVQFTPGAPAASGSFPHLQFPKQETLRITRRSSSDLSRAASKFKNAKSLLAAALRRATGTGMGTGGASGGSNGGSAAAAAQPGAGGEPSGDHQSSDQQPQQQQPKQEPRPQQKQEQGGSRLMWASPDAKHAGGIAAAGAAAGCQRGPELGAGGEAPAAGGQAEGTTTTPKKVALAGGVMTKAPDCEPTWARIATVRWDAPKPVGRGPAT